MSTPRPAPPCAAIGIEGQTALAEQICEIDGGPLAGLAAAMISDSQRASQMVVDVICNYLPSHASASHTPAARRFYLTRELYTRCHQTSEHATADRSAIALALVSAGKMTYTEVSDLMDLSHGTVAALLRQALINRCA